MKKTILGLVLAFTMFSPQVVSASNHRSWCGYRYYYGGGGFTIFNTYVRPCSPTAWYGGQQGYLVSSGRY